ncbi:MAG: hypothetical protein N2319_12055 [Candidatus Kapabacteria bacterium]|nr:hypothetical protein [Candidatus Kapabacteria bacterium]
MKKNKILLLILGTVSLLSGFIIYLFKPFEYIMFEILYKFPFVGHYIFNLRKIMISDPPIIFNNTIITKIIFNNLSDGLWLFSLQIIIIYIWDFQYTIKIILLTFAIAVTYEIFQLIKIIPGVFDIFDILTYLIFSLFGNLIFLRYIRGKNEIFN